MQFGFNLPISGALAAPEIMTRIAREGERLGYDYLTVTDHVVLPDMAEPGYPCSRKRRVLFARHAVPARAADLRRLSGGGDQPAAAGAGGDGGFAAPATTVLTAKMLATIEVLVGRAADRRDRRGVAQGRVRRGGDDPVRRARRCRARSPDYLAAFRRIWSEEKPAIDGKIRPFRPAGPQGRSRCRPPLPIWVGGESGPSLRRAAKFADAWYPIGANNFKAFARQPAPLREPGSPACASSPKPPAARPTPSR